MADVDRVGPAPPLPPLRKEPDGRGPGSGHPGRGDDDDTGDRPGGEDRGPPATDDDGAVPDKPRRQRGGADDDPGPSDAGHVDEYV